MSQTTAGRKIKFKPGKNPVHQTRYFKLKNCKNQGQIERGRYKECADRMCGQKSSIDL